jgi:hypothetical protein
MARREQQRIIGKNLAMKLLPLSTSPPPEQGQALAKLLGKELNEIEVAYIENAYDNGDEQEIL